jgi:hypothetical protein
MPNRTTGRTKEAVMNTTLSAAIRMPHTASVAAPAPLAHGVPAEPCAPAAAMPAAHRPRGSEIGGTTIAPAIGTRLGGTDGSDRIGGTTRPSVGGGWYGQDQAQLAGGGPLRG